MANQTRQISIFLNGKQVEATIKNIAGAFAKASNELANMVVGSDEYIAKLEEVKGLGSILAEHRQKIKGVTEEQQAAAGSMNALQQEYSTATRTLNNLAVGTEEYQTQLQKVQALESQITEIRRNQQAQNTAAAGSIDAIQKEYQEATSALNGMVVGSEEYQDQLKKVQTLESQLTEIRRDQQKVNVAVAGSLRALEEELAQERVILRDLVIGTKEYQDQLKKVNALDDDLQKHQASLKGVGQGWSLAKVGLDQFVGIAAGAFAVDSLLGYGKALFNTGIQLDALEKKARTVFGATLPQVTAEAEKNAAAMGLTTTQYINAAAAIQDILIPMGFQRKEAADISTQLINLSGALSEWTGGQVSATQVSDILSSALTGEREQLKQLGIVLQQSDIDTRLAEKGLSKLTGTMRQQAEAAATLELILEKSTDAQTGFANGADSAVRRQAELTAKIQETAEKLSRLLLPVFEGLAGGIEVVVDSIGFVVDALDDMTGSQSRSVESTISQKDEFNALIGVLQNVNTSEETRNRAINELQSKYPGYIGNIDLHKASESQLNTILQSGNEIFAKRIFLQNKEDKLSDLEAKRNSLQQELFKAEKNLAAANAGQNITFGLDQASEIAKWENVVSARKEQLKDLQQAQDAFIQEQDEFAKRFNILPGETSTSTGEPTDPGGGSGNGDKPDPKEAEKLQQDLLKLVERTTEMRRDLLAKSQEDELQSTIRAIEKRYEAEIQKAIELEKKGVTQATAQRVALEQLKQEEITLVTRQIAEKAREDSEKEIAEQVRKEWEARAKADQEGYEWLQERQKEREDAQKEIDEFKAEAKADKTKDKQALELEELDLQYQNLLTLADEYFNSDLELKAAYEAKKKAITEKYAKDTQEQKKKFDEALVKSEFELQAARLEAYQQGAALLGSFFDESSVVAKALFLFEKVVAAQSVILNLQKEKAAIWAAARLGTIFDPTGASAVALATPQIVAANIRAGINLATIAATAITSVVKQKAEGGYLSVTGEDDRRSYTAQVIPPPATGLLPQQPVIFQSQATAAPVLASERGAEYFVSAESLRNPYVANLTRMIDNIQTTGGRGIPQFADGGVNTTGPGLTSVQPPAAPASSPSPEMVAIIARNTAAMEALVQTIGNGIFAILQDSTIVDAIKRYGKINSVSGDYYR